MATVIVDRCPDCYAKTGDLYFHREKQCVMRQMPSAQRDRKQQLRRYSEHFRQRAEDFDDELGRTVKANRRRARFNRDSSQAAAEALEFLESRLHE